MNGEFEALGGAYYASSESAAQNLLFTIYYSLSILLVTALLAPDT